MAAPRLRLVGATEPDSRRMEVRQTMCAAMVRFGPQAQCLDRCAVATCHGAKIVQHELTCEKMAPLLFSSTFRPSMQVLHDNLQALPNGRRGGMGWFRAILLATVMCASGISLAQAPVSSAPGARTDRAGEVVFVAGSVSRTGGAGSSVLVEKGQSLREGDRIQTQVDGYVYVRMADGGLLVVRPSSELHVDRWQFDPLNPQLSEIRYTLIGGVARYVSGRGSQAAKDRFRFNTPIAAIGVRGTDFTVLTEALFTRVTVRTGGVVVSRLGDGCRADALGPCEGGDATELFASAREKMIQLRQGDLRPELVDVNAAPSPDRVRPPANAEPTASRRPSPLNESAPLIDSRAERVVGVYVAPPQHGPEPASSGSSNTAGSIGGPVSVVPLVPPSLDLVGARRDGLTDASASPGPKNDLLTGRSLITVNSFFALAGNLQNIGVLPGAGSADFKLASHQGVVFDKLSNIAIDSIASNGSLRIDFANRSFVTGFDVKAGGMAARIEGHGSVGGDGVLLSKPLLSPTLIQGVVGAAASEAAYLYQTPLSRQYQAAGVASWGK